MATQEQLLRFFMEEQKRKSPLEQTQGMPYGITQPTPAPTQVRPTQWIAPPLPIQNPISQFGQTDVANLMKQMLGTKYVGQPKPTATGNWLSNAIKDVGNWLGTGNHRSSPRFK